MNHQQHTRLYSTLLANIYAALGRNSLNIDVLIELMQNQRRTEQRRDAFIRPRAQSSYITSHESTNTVTLLHPHHNDIPNEPFISPRPVFFHTVVNAQTIPNRIETFYIITRPQTPEG